MEIPGFLLSGPPRTKKTSLRVVSIPKKGARKCGLCGHRPGFPKVLPSEAHEAWHAEAMKQCLRIRAEMGRRGVVLPLAHALNVRALFYRERNVGDAVGFYQALADLLQDAGIVANDSQCVSWNGSELRKDAGRPRIEVHLEVVREQAVAQDLFAETRG